MCVGGGGGNMGGGGGERIPTIKETFITINELCILFPTLNYLKHSEIKLIFFAESESVHTLQSSFP